MNLGKRIAERMKELGLTQRQLAEKTGLTQPAISSYIRDMHLPGYHAIEVLSKALDVPVAWFFEESASIEPASSDRPVSERSHPNPQQASVMAFPVSGVSRGGTLVIGHYFPMQRLPPPSQAVSAGIVTNFYQLIFNSLAERLPDGRPRGVLAVDWKPVGKSWFFRIRQGVGFQDGTPLTVEDVIWYYNRYLKDNCHQHQIQGVEMLNESLIQIHLRAPCRLDDLPMPFITAKGMGDPPDLWVGTGPFQPIELTPTFWRLKANPYYYLGSPFFDEIQIRGYADPPALEKALAEREVHFAIGSYLEGENFVAKADGVPQRYHLHFRLKEPLVASLALRKAIWLGLDRKAIAASAGLKSPQFSSGPFDYLLGDSSPNPPLPPDSQTAKQLLEQVEFPQDSIFRVQSYETDPTSRSIAASIVVQLNQIGIRTTLDEPPDGATDDEPPHAVLAARNVPLFALECRIWSTTSPPGYNLSDYENPKVDELIQCYRDSGERHELYHLRELIQKDVPDIPLFYKEMPVTYVKSLRALEDRVVLLSALSEINNWYFDGDIAVEERQSIAAVR